MLHEQDDAEVLWPHISTSAKSLKCTFRTFLAVVAGCLCALTAPALAGRRMPCGCGVPATVEPFACSEQSRTARTLGKMPCQTTLVPSRSAVAADHDNSPATS